MNRHPESQHGVRNSWTRNTWPANEVVMLGPMGQDSGLQKENVGSRDRLGCG